MGRPPAYVFVVRHGNRLDVVDKQWHLSSPAPYDPPLTYGGWTQSKGVGAKIASVIRDQETRNQEAEPTKKKRYNFVIHSSPFLRCVQTSIAISAGLTRPSDNGSSSNAPSRKGSAASIVQASTQTASPALPPSSTDFKNHAKTVLRLDAFLGEWLSPDYYENITPPPKSDVMLAMAKAELLRKENYNEYLEFQAKESPRPQGQLWGASPTRNSFDNTLNGESESVANATSESASGLRGYTAPVTNYAISPSEPIPRGFVAHARDTCANIDYQWDSSRPDVAWGNGGQLPEEWATMHQRFRGGLKNLVGWYANTEQPGSPVTRMSPSTSPQPESPTEEPEDFEVEDVVIIVSHGAGCNALIGAVTEQPVLADVAMSSISIAKRRAEYDATENPLSNKRASSLDNALLRKRITLADVFEMKLYASTEHLASNSSFHSRSRSTSLGGPYMKPGSRDQSNGSYSSLRDINFGSYYGSTSSLGRSNSSSNNASLGSMRRPSNPVSTINISPSVYSSSPRDANTGITVGSGAFSFTPSSRPNRAGSIGLWQPREETTVEEEPENNMLLNFGTYNHATTKKDEEPPTKKVSQAPSPIDQGEVQIPPAQGPPVPQDPPRTDASSLTHQQSLEKPASTTMSEGANGNSGGLWGSSAPSTTTETESPRNNSSAASKRPRGMSDTEGHL